MKNTNWKAKSLLIGLYLSLAAPALASDKAETRSLAILGGG